MSNDKIRQLAHRIAGKFKPEKIILFGSYAWGKPHQNSDVDLFIIKDTFNTRQSAAEIDRYLSDRDVPLDIIVARSQKIQERLDLGDPFWKKIINQGEVLYESILVEGWLKKAKEDEMSIEAILKEEGGAPSIVK